MIGVDTNVLVRHFVQDDPDQGARATAFLTHECSPDKPGFIDVVVLCEFAWVLARNYRYHRRDILRAIDTLLETAAARLQNAYLVRQALDRARTDGGDFPDHLIWLLNREHGCDGTVTFDRRFANLTGSRLL